MESLNEEIKEMISCAVYVTPELRFSLFYNVEEHILNVFMKKIERLPTNLPEESADSFVQVYLLPAPTKLRPKQVFTTPMVKRSYEPFFDCMATFRGMSLKDLTDEELVFRVYVNTEVRFLGGVYYPLPSIDNFGDEIVAEIQKFPEEASLKVRKDWDLEIP